MNAGWHNTDKYYDDKNIKKKFIINCYLFNFNHYKFFDKSRNYMNINSKKYVPTFKSFN